jgi:hypothetical protein
MRKKPGRFSLMVKYTEKLMEKGEERKRLTKQLAVLVGAVANDIAQSLPEGARHLLEKDQIVTIGPGKVRPSILNLKVIRIRSNIGETKFLANIPILEKEPPTVFVPDMEPGTRFFLDNDPRAKVYVASSEHYLKFANSIPEIVNGFEQTADQLSDTLRKAFDKLKDIAGIGGGELVYPEFDPQLHVIDEGEKE